MESKPPRARRRVAATVCDDQRGIGLFEVIASTLIATVAVLGLAYSFGVGRGLIDRYQVARAGLGEAQLKMDELLTLPKTSLANGNRPFLVGGRPAGLTEWTIANVDDPQDGLGGADANGTVDMKQITVTVSWALGGVQDRLVLDRLILK